MLLKFMIIYYLCGDHLLLLHTMIFMKINKKQEDELTNKDHLSPSALELLPPPPPQ